MRIINAIGERLGGYNPNYSERARFHRILANMQQAGLLKMSEKDRMPIIEDLKLSR
jgi:hypothetical protein